MWRKAIFIGLIALLVLFGATGCADVHTTQTRRDVLEADSQLALQWMLDRDQSLALRLDDSAAYAIFPHGESGRGIVYDCDGTLLGYAREAAAFDHQTACAPAILIIFQADSDLEQFTDGSGQTFEFDALPDPELLTALETLH